MANETEIINLLQNASTTYSSGVSTGNNMMYITMFVIGMLFIFGMFIIYMIARSKDKKRELRVVKQSMQQPKQVYIEQVEEPVKLENSQDEEVLGVVQPHTFRTWKKFRSWLSLKTKPQKCFLIEMTHFSGGTGHYITPESTKKFKIGNNTYIIDTSCISPNITSKLPMLRYHEGFALPYKLSIDIEQMHDRATQEAPKTQMSYYPDVLTGVIKSEYVKGVIAGGEVAPMLKKIFIVSLISCIGMAGCLIILLTGSDLLKDVL